MFPEIKSQFMLDPNIIYLNHGSYGACPKPIFKSLIKFQKELEKEPVKHLAYDLENNLNKFLNKKMMDDLAKLDIFMHGDVRKYTVESALGIKLFWVGSASENSSGTGGSDTGIRNKIRKKLSEIV